MTFRVDAELQAAFVAACKANDMSAAQVLRSAMREYLSSNAQASLKLEGGKQRRPASKKKGSERL